MQSLGVGDSLLTLSPGGGLTFSTLRVLCYFEGGGKCIRAIEEHLFSSLKWIFEGREGVNREARGNTTAFLLPVKRIIAGGGGSQVTPPPPKKLIE